MTTTTRVYLASRNKKGEHVFNPVMDSTVQKDEDCVDALPGVMTGIMMWRVQHRECSACGQVIHDFASESYVYQSLESLNTPPRCRFVFAFHCDSNGCKDDACDAVDSAIATMTRSMKKAIWKCFNPACGKLITKEEDTVSCPRPQCKLTYCSEYCRKADRVRHEELAHYLE